MTAILANILKSPSLRSILLVSVAAIISFPLYGAFFVIPSFTALVMENTEDEASRTAEHLAALILPPDEKVTGDIISTELEEAVEMVQRDFQIDRLKIFSTDGETVFSTESGDVGEVITEEYFPQIVATGTVYSNRVHEDTTTSEGEMIHSDVMEIYVPVLRSGTVVGVFEIYYNIHRRIEKLEKLLFFSYSILFSIVVALFVAVTIVLFNASKTAIERERAEERLRVAEGEATQLSEFLKNVFGRYLSADVMNSLLEDPSAFEMGGELRSVTIMITDLRGFTALSERLAPEDVVRMLNAYLEVMVDLIDQYDGTVNDIVGDSLIVSFGAPQDIPDRAQRAIACAITMQNAMAEVNKTNHALGLPTLEMGIGLHDSEVIVGNIGSSKRTKYSMVGSGVNLASRVESYTVGGQILISESVCGQAREVLCIDGEWEVFPEGATAPLRICEIGGIAGSYNVALEKEDLGMTTLAQSIPVQVTMLEGENIREEYLAGHLVRLSKKSAVVVMDEPVELFVNVKMNLTDVDEALAGKGFYGKVIDQSGEDMRSHTVRFTSVPLEVASYFLAHQQYAI